MTDVNASAGAVGGAGGGRVGSRGAESREGTGSGSGEKHGAVGSCHQGIKGQWLKIFEVVESKDGPLRL